MPVRIVRIVVMLLIHVLIASLPFFEAQALQFGKQQAMTVSVFVSASSTYATSKTFDISPELIRHWKQARFAAATVDPSWIRAMVSVMGKTYAYDHDRRLFTTDGQQLLLPKQARSHLESCVQTVEQLHYGSLTPWSEVKHSFRRMDYATVVDLETGQRFRVQRRAGSRHADVQPLTKQDTNIMKEIYQGKWSWRRRAIRVELDGYSFAASMHGMPHGAGAIKGNAFPGHFCIHFFGSSTHRRLDPDPSHSMMIQKAAGLLPQALTAAAPKEIVEYFLTSLNEHDTHTLEMLTSGEALSETIRSIETVRRPLQVRLLEPSGELLVEADVQFEYFTRHGKNKADTWTFVLQRFSPWERWRIVRIDT
ncbi:hypothetical protein ACAF76_014600 [Brevibacillus sp. TJ4]|uniref:hypothetical protein n=1 Tax=Brevibacillus sp. TJ4 TaxID=3234853 RepID=UPI003B9E09D0